MLKKLLIITASLLICFSTVHAERTIKIGVILPLTGDMAAVGSACRDAVQMALKDSENTNHNKYKIIFEDDRLQPNEVAKVAQKLISLDKVSGIISTWSYGGRIVAPMAERAKFLT